MTTGGWVDEVGWWIAQRRKVAVILARVRDNPRTEPQAIAELLATMDVLDAAIVRRMPVSGPPN